MPPFTSSSSAAASQMFLSAMSDDIVDNTQALRRGDEVRTTRKLRDTLSDRPRTGLVLVVGAALVGCRKITLVASLTMDMTRDPYFHMTACCTSLAALRNIFEGLALPARVRAACSAFATPKLGV